MKDIRTSITMILLKARSVTFRYLVRRRGMYLIIGAGLILLLSIITLVSIRKNKLYDVVFQGKWGDSSYHISYRVKEGINYQKEVDDLLGGMFQALAGHDEQSALSAFNRHDCTSFPIDSMDYLYDILAHSKSLYHATQGAFDPTIVPLTTLWKNHLLQGTLPSENELREVQSYVGLDYIVMNPQRIKKLKENVTIDLREVLASYGVDLVTNFLQAKKVPHFCVMVGSTGTVQGTDRHHRPWQVIHTVAPVKQLTEGRSIYSQLTHQAVCKVQQGLWSRDGEASILIDPATGQLVHGNILAAVVYANDGLTAKAYATAILIKTHEEALKWVENTKDIEVLWIYCDEEGAEKMHHSAGLQLAPTKEGTQDIVVTRCS
eukprot:gene3014-3765_t